MFTVTKREVFINLKEAKECINKYCIKDNYFNSDINILESASDRDNQKEVINSEESDKFIKKVNAEKSYIKKEV